MGHTIDFDSEDYDNIYDRLSKLAYHLVKNDETKGAAYLLKTMELMKEKQK